ncbi:hypothetical protein [Azospirillum doebereinerae]|uniref:Uncharacterized protein n=1 Tax=Azospirillum doebereinerae TaxID=92933 RepID=A0A3S0VIY0_9PROT|nr:hypothetical protein [Azospirillum doebereinerae]MCG5244084.1 hypothetical protein [Azospirillum doebereinerae]RUQ72173.1 hypothetical protein EJ913_11495 [Azospirillum doebereinerae]
MFNILTVIISVALTAVMGAAGVFYVGSAFTTAGPKAAAVGIVQSLSQVDAAWTLYASNGNTTTFGAAGATFPTMSGAATQTDLINTGFLAAVPTAPTIASTWGGGATTTIALDLTNPATASGLTGNTNFANGGVFLVLASTALSQCTEIARAGGQITATGTLAVPGTGLNLLAASQANFIAAFTGYKFGCVQMTTATGLTLNNVAGAAGDANKYVAYYKF